MISVKRVYAGDGYRYLLRGIADQEDLPGASAVTSYYTQPGNPHGRWIGAGLDGIGDGAGLAVGSRVSEQQLERMFRDGADPLTGRPLGRRFHQVVGWRERADMRIAGLSAQLGDADRTDSVEQIEAEEKARPTIRPVAGFDVTFSPPKSVSVLWGLGDQGVREQVYEAHRAAIRDVLAVLERDVARTRIGSNGVARVETKGVVGATFDHWDSRSGDPQLHTHLLMLNRVQAADDDRWRTLDSRDALYPAVVALSELYDNVLADHITARLGVGWENRGTRHKAKNAVWEIETVPHELIAAFSSRSADIEAEKDRLVDAYRRQHGRSPNDRTIIRLRQIATLATRPAKEVRSLAELTTDWAERAHVVLREDPVAWVGRRTRFARSGRERPPLWRVDDLAAGGALDQLVREAFDELSTERSTWTVWNARAAVARAAMPYRMSDADERDRLVADATARVLAMSVDLTPHERAFTPARLRQRDGRSVFASGQVFTSAEVLAAERRLLDGLHASDAAALSLVAIGNATRSPTRGGHRLTADQADAITRIALSGRRIDVLLGPAGSGKTTALDVLRHAWEREHGTGSVIGFAPSAAAAGVLAESLGIPTDNTAKLLHEARRNTDRQRELDHLLLALPGIGRDDPHWRHHLQRAERTWPYARPWHLRRPGAMSNTGRARLTSAVGSRITELTTEIGNWRFAEGQLVIVDEAAMAGTLALDAIAGAAAGAGAKLLLVGDHAQLGAIDAGGAFGMLARDYGDDLVPELVALHRFQAPWEAAATRSLRRGDASVLNTYQRHGRLHPGETDEVTDAAYRAWLADEAAGHTSLLIAASADAVRELAMRARADRVAAGQVESGGVVLHDGSLAGRGDRVVTRHNDRRLITGRHSWVRNRDTWTVRRRHRDGSLTVTRHHGVGTITLPADYVRQHVELAYATTTHRAQGASVDTTHVLVTGTSTARELFYVAMTRGRLANHAYVATDLEPDDQHLGDDIEPIAITALTAVLQRSAAPRSAHETARDLHERAESFGQLADEYTTLAAQAFANHVARIIDATPLPHIADPTTSPAYPALAATIRYAHDLGIDVLRTLPQLATHLEPRSDDPIAHLHQRLAALVEEARRTHRARPLHRIAGLIPAAVGTADPALRRALDERKRHLERRAETLARTALTKRPAWLDELGPPPSTPRDRSRWIRCVATIAAYRERHDITSTHPLGDNPQSEDRPDLRLAFSALRRAQQLSGLLKSGREHAQAARSRRSGVGR
ncbi:MobF family relaxase [Jiangella alkaliphila]|uniref:Conjugative relaxase domain-containing protein, TrwC/TraI family n=1 Tax=Jiangella alkaliphila TaxID=419479 RepID=A0A1H2GBS8_9ACTN|nr:MobF family relaxase [Jiangella alkaliphila]SDU16848.1 conjugative relaxase domain-containing protein, TrwC/TraI family [Jiangella alkaliphila]